MILAVWIAALLAKFASAARLSLSRDLRLRYFFLCAWAVGAAVVSIVRMRAGDTQTWAYAKLWAYTEWPLIALQTLAAGELALCLVRQFPRHDRPLYRCGAAMIGAAALLVSLALVCVVECRLMHWNEPLVVQIAIAASRVTALAWAGVMLISLFAMRSISGVNQNCRNIRVGMTVYFSIVAAEQYTMLAWHYFVPGYSPLFLSAAAWAVIAADIALWSWIAMRVSPAREADATHAPEPSGYWRDYHRAIAATLRRRRDAWRRVRAVWTLGGRFRAV